MKQTEFNQNKIMDKKPISISFANQKGGIGKSTLTILAASWLRYVRGLNVLVVDCDFPQNSIVELREREKKGCYEKRCLQAHAPATIRTAPKRKPTR
ncbi:MAG: ParA family protein [Alistipes finegoldii]|uniref:ParA family protein n=1 Tax=Alistipes finegoldii TaxID=214856 RepID=UPI0039A14747